MTPHITTKFCQNPMYGKKDITFLNFRKFEKMQIDGPGTKQNSRFLQIDGCVFTNIFVRRKNKLVISWV